MVEGGVFAMSDKVIIKAAVNGGRRREDNPNIPLTPAEVAAEAVRCYEAGASIVHYHARTPDGGTTNDPAFYAEADRLIREKTPLLTLHTTVRAPDQPFAAILRQLELAPPDIVALNMGHIVI